MHMRSDSVKVSVIVPVYNVEKYTRAVDKLKEEAINSLPELKF